MQWAYRVSGSDTTLTRDWERLLESLFGQNASLYRLHPPPPIHPGEMVADGWLALVVKVFLLLDYGVQCLWLMLRIHVMDPDSLTEF